MRTVRWAFPIVAAVVANGCVALVGPRSNDIPPRDTPGRELEMRFLGRPSGGAMVWIATGDDGVANYRYEGRHLFIDPGTAQDVEALLPLLREQGLDRTAPGPNWIFLTSADEAARAGAARLSREIANSTIVMAGAPRPDPVLDLGLELSSRVLGVSDQPGLLGLRLRFINQVLLFLPSAPDVTSLAMVNAAVRRLEAENLHVTLAHVADGGELTRDLIEILDPEATIGMTESPQVVTIPPPGRGKLLAMRSDGIQLDAGRHLRAPAGHWLECHAAAAECGGDVPIPATGPLLVPVRAGDIEGMFLVHQSARSYFTPRLVNSIPDDGDGLAHARRHGHRRTAPMLHRATLGEGDRQIHIRRWQEPVIPDFEIDGVPVLGILGFDVLDATRLEIRPRERRMTFVPTLARLTRRKDQKPARPPRIEGTRQIWSSIPLDGAIVLARFDGTFRALLIDLSSLRSRFHFSTSELAKRNLTVEVVPHAWLDHRPEGATWRHTEIKATEMTIQELDLSGTVVPDVPVLAVEDPIDSAVLGLDFLRSFDRVSIDFRKRQLELEREIPPKPAD